jgi:hypothetical protein
MIWDITPVIKATVTKPTKPQAIVVRGAALLLLAALLMRAINPALLPPLKKPVIMAIATIVQEERKRK